MKTRWVLLASVVLAILALGWFATSRTANEVDETVLGYPAPIYPSYMLGDVTQQELDFLGRSIARAVKGESGDLGHIGVGEKGLLIIRDDQDMRIVEAAIKAVRERGGDAGYISRSRLIAEYSGVFPPELVGVEPWIRPPVDEGIIEAILQYGIDAFPRELIEKDYPELRQTPRLSPTRMLELRAQLVSTEVREALPKNWTEFPASEMAKLFLVDALWDYLRKHPEYDYYFSEFRANSAFRRIETKVFGEKFKGGWRLKDLATTVAEGYMFPSDLRDLITERASQPTQWIETVHITDGEGTDLRFSLTPEQAQVWGRANQGRMDFYPAAATTKPLEEGGMPQQVLPEAEGVIVGTINHKGVYPTMRVHVKQGMVERVEGGGRVGNLFRALLNDETIRNAHYPGLKYPGHFYVWHYSIGTNPKAALDYRSISADLRRSGISHFGFGYETVDPQKTEYAGKLGLPFRHGFHVHQHFPSYEVTLRGRGEDRHTLKIVDRGHLTALDDAEVKALAARYGRPEDVLSVEWVPDTPGINSAGDYQKDYGDDPVGYWARRLEKVQNGSYPYLRKRTVPFAGDPTKLEARQ